jgi:pimeloyl-ACP methyl ester carboxylesterase
VPPLVLAMREARKLVVPDAGHHPNMEHPALFNRAVLDFLGELAR